MLWPGQDQMADERYKEHDDQHPYTYDQHRPPHVSDPVNCTQKCLWAEDIGQATKGTFRIDYHTVVEKVAVAGKVATWESNLVPSHRVGKPIPQTICILCSYPDGWSTRSITELTADVAGLCCGRTLTVAEAERNTHSSCALLEVRKSKASIITFLVGRICLWWCSYCFSLLWVALACFDCCRQYICDVLSGKSFPPKRLVDETRVIHKVRVSKTWGFIPRAEFALPFAGSVVLPFDHSQHHILKMGYVTCV